MTYRSILKTTALAAFLGSAGTYSAHGAFIGVVGSNSIDGSLCVGFDCVANEAFGFDTIRLKENNLRIHFDDTSVAAAFPPNDWRIYANDSANGGSSYFGIEDATAGRFVFRVFAGARSNALVVDSQGDLGLGTTTPATDIDIKTGDTPTVRLQQDGTSGFTPQTWDMAGNEVGFFIRDATSGSTLPFRVLTGAPSQALLVDGDGNVGIGSGTSPDGPLHITRTNSSGALVMLELENDGNPEIELNNTNINDQWRLSGGNNFVIKDVDGASTTNVLTLTETGDLTVTGSVTTATTTYPDYVFAPDYELMPLSDVAAFIDENGHLPKIPTEAQVMESGLNITEMQVSLLEKIEELTLYTIDQHDRIEMLIQTSQMQQSTIETLRAEIAALIQ